MISKKTIKNELVSSIELQFRAWLENVRLNGQERDEIENLISELKNLIDY